MTDKTSRKMFVNLAVRDLKKSMAFFSSLGFGFNPTFTVKKAVAAGGRPAMDPQDHGFMYASSFYDLDGHHWEVFWMDPAATH